jgi:hypothetical protein
VPPLNRCPDRPDASTGRLLSYRGQSTQLTVLVHWVHNPVDAGILADHGVLWVDQDDLEVLVRGILVDPVRVENP